MFLNDIKKELANNEDLRKLFGVVGFEKDAETDIIVRFEDGKLFRIMAKGSEQKLRGLKWDKKRPDLIVCDDMENDELVMNKERRMKFKKWFNSALLPVRSDKGIVRIVGTILHYDSLLNSFMPAITSKTTVDTPLKMSSTVSSGWHSLLYRAHDKEYKHLLWPQKMGERELKRIREIYEHQGLLDVYAQEYLNNPLDESNTHFRRSDFLPLKSEDKEKPVTWYITLDGAWSLAQSADYTVIMVAAMDHDGYIQIRHVVKERMDPLETAEMLFTFAKDLDPEMVVTEKGAFANGILPSLYKMMEERDHYFRIELFNPATDKVHRSQSVRLRARAGKIKVDKDADWWPGFEEELLAFPRQGHDDQVDAFSLIGIALNKFNEAPTLKELIEDAREEEMKESGLFDQGRSTTTGY